MLIPELQDRILRKPQVLQLVGISRSSIQNRIDDGTFPPSIQLGPRAVGWRLSDIDAWMKSREITVKAKNIKEGGKNG